MNNTDVNNDRHLDPPDEQENVCEYCGETIEFYSPKGFWEPLCPNKFCPSKFEDETIEMEMAEKIVDLQDELKTIKAAINKKYFKQMGL